MSKYKELVEAYSGTIARIKSLRLQIAKVQHRYYLLNIRSDDLEATANMVEEKEALEYELDNLVHDLDYEIRREYDNVPFRTTRIACISAFYREAGLPVARSRG